MDASPAVTPPRKTGNVRVGRVLLLVFGGLVTLVALGLLIAGGLLGWAHAFARDSDGYVTTQTKRLSTPTFALTSGTIDLGTDPVDENFDVGDLATVRVRATGSEGAPVFVGIGRQRDVDRFLQRVAHDEIVDADISGVDPRDVDVHYRRIPGTVTPAPPADQTFWDASASGAGTQTVTWDLRSGDWSVVVMNTNAAAGVTVDASIGAKADWLLPAAIALLIAGAIALAVGILMIVLGATGLRGPAAPGPGRGDRRCSRRRIGGGRRRQLSAPPRRPARRGPEPRDAARQAGSSRSRTTSSWPSCGWPSGSSAR